METTPTPSTPRASLQDGIDNMWKFQLRKENAVLLEKQETQQKILQALAVESTKAKKDFDERYAELKARISNLEHDERKDRHAFETCQEDMATLKAQMGVMMEKQERQVHGAQATAPNFDRPSSRMSTASPTDIPNSSRPATATSATPSTHQPASTKPSKLKAANLIRTPVTNVTLRTSNRHTNKAVDIAGPMTRTRSRSRSRSLPHEPPAAPALQYQTPTPVPRRKAKAPANSTPASASSSGQTVKIPRVHQGTRSLKAYYNSATAIWTSLPGIKDQKLEIQFIALFIKGMRDEDKRNILVGELQQQHQSRTKKDGKVEILCKWKDVGQSIQDAGLMDMAASQKERHR